MSIKRSSYPQTDADMPAEEHGNGIESAKNGDEKVLDSTPIGEPFEAKTSGTDLPVYETDDYARRKSAVVTTAEDLITRVIDLEDDPTQNPWTFRVFFLGNSP
jgi:hypothetical protein